MSNLRQCSACGAMLEPDDRFCQVCGRPAQEAPAAQIYCESCGHPNRSDDRFCIACGAPLNAGGPVPAPWDEPGEKQRSGSDRGRAADGEPEEGLAAKLKRSFGKNREPDSDSGTGFAAKLGFRKSRPNGAEDSDERDGAASNRRRFAGDRKAKFRDDRDADPFDDFFEDVFPEAPSSGSASPSAPEGMQERRAPAHREEPDPKTGAQSSVHSANSAPAHRPQPAPKADDPFGRTTVMGTAAPKTDDPFGRSPVPGTSVPKANDPFGRSPVPETAAPKADDPFGRPPVSGKSTPTVDPFRPVPPHPAEPAVSAPRAQTQPQERRGSVAGNPSASAVRNPQPALKPDDPFGRPPKPGISAPKADDPFGKPTVPGTSVPKANDPFGRSPVSGKSTPTADPFRPAPPHPTEPTVSAPRVQNQPQERRGSVAGNPAAKGDPFAEAAAKTAARRPDAGLFEVDGESRGGKSGRGAENRRGSVQSKPDPYDDYDPYDDCDARDSGKKRKSGSRLGMVLGIALTLLILLALALVAVYVLGRAGREGPEQMPTLPMDLSAPVVTEEPALPSQGEVVALSETVLHAGPGGNFASFGTVHAGDVMAYLSQTEIDSSGLEWYYVSLNGDSGWIPSSCARLTPAPDGAD